MLRYDRQTKPGLVALYDIRPGNGAGPFLQPRSPHGAFTAQVCTLANPNESPATNTMQQTNGVNLCHYAQRLQQCTNYTVTY